MNVDNQVYLVSVVQLEHQANQENKEHLEGQENLDSLEK